MTDPNAQNAARPTGKRQLHGASPVSAQSYEDKRTERREPEGEDSPGGGVTKFPAEVVGEMRKVIWPTGRQMVSYTLIVFAFLIVLTALVWSVDWATSWVVEQAFVR